MYHRENEQEDFLVLSGECLLGSRVRSGCCASGTSCTAPAGTDHVFVGAGERLCAVLAVGAAGSHDTVYPVNETALRHGAGVQTETRDPKEAYAGVNNITRIPYPDGALPDVPPPNL